MRAAVVAVMVLAGSAHAHPGGPETSRSITFGVGDPSLVSADTSFGVLQSHDGGSTWQWMCELALGYQWPFQPDFAYAGDGALFATSLANAVVLRANGCTFDPVGSDMFSSITVGPDRALYMASVGLADAKIYRSTDDGLTFPIAATAGVIGDWYSSIEVARSDSARVYLAGYRVEPQFKRSWQLYTSRDAGQTFAPSVFPASMGSSESSYMQIVGIAEPDTLYVRVNQADDAFGSTLGRSTDAGATWSQLAASPSPLAFVLRRNGDLVKAVEDPPSAWVSHDRGDHWDPLAAPPHISCLVERADGELWACTRNYAPGDGAAIMATTDLGAWRSVLRFEDLTGPVACAAGTVQADTCALPNQWCPIVKKLAIASGQDLCVPPEIPLPEPPDPEGCCDTGGSAGGPALLFVICACLLRRRVSVGQYQDPE
jgi:hypothetical protein